MTKSTQLLTVCQLTNHFTFCRIDTARYKDTVLTNKLEYTAGRDMVQFLLYDFEVHIYFIYSYLMSKNITGMNRPCHVPSRLIWRCMVRVCKRVMERGKKNHRTLPFSFPSYNEKSQISPYML